MFLSLEHEPSSIKYSLLQKIQVSQWNEPPGNGNKKRLNSLKVRYVPGAVLLAVCVSTPQEFLLRQRSAQRFTILHMPDLKKYTDRGSRNSSIFLPANTAIKVILYGTKPRLYIRAKRTILTLKNSALRNSLKMREKETLNSSIMSGLRKRNWRTNWRRD